MFSYIYAPSVLPLSPPVPLEIRPLKPSQGGVGERCKLPQWGLGRFGAYKTQSAVLVAVIFLRTNVKIHV